MLSFSKCHYNYYVIMFMDLSLEEKCTYCNIHLPTAIFVIFDGPFDNEVIIVNSNSSFGIKE